MPDERLHSPSRYLPPDKDHTQHIINPQSGEPIGTRYWAPFDNPAELVDKIYWFSLFSPDTYDQVRAAVIIDETGQRQLIWSEGIASQQLLTRDERTRILLSVSSAVVDQYVGIGDQPLPMRWIRAYAHGEKDDEGASLVAGAFTQMLVESRIDQAIIYTAAVAYDNDGPDVHILTDEML